ncbi:DUF2029 domain-containing protein [Sphingomonas sp. AAP5]|uniref:DUF2029 domain-containing protein n=1 Tax=Sphingomonas sp. AAP5 TaxID=1523415 RepID=UPI0010575435|nr:DUF2029 domain-containing protein [Sphingomonas sp. AAP5]QBM77198.1 DUF2029 domain-containing protein [Sphingomonas sp. AAP5]
MTRLVGLPWRWLAAALVVFAALALLHPIDHDESQYVAAALLSAQGELPYRDYAYLQTPLQPLVFAPIAWAAGWHAWLALRLANALLGVCILGCVWRAAREAGAGAGAALATAGLLGACDILLFSLSTARNDALPAAFLAAALIPIGRAERDGATQGSAVLVGVLLAAAAAAKLSYALPALAYGGYALFDRRHRPVSVLLGAMPVAGLVAWFWALAPAAFVFETITFPAVAPAEFYADRPWKLSLLGKAIDSLKFLALGPALLALVAIRKRLWRPDVLTVLLGAGLVAALLPLPTWRQYLLPALPPLFVLLALEWQRARPARWMRVAAAVSVGAGLAPTLIEAAQSRGATSLLAAVGEGRAIALALDQAGVRGPVATLSPQFLGATHALPDRRFATGPFYFRSHALLPAPREAAMHLVSADRLVGLDQAPPAAILVGGEGGWSSGDATLDARLERWALMRHYRAVPIASARFRLYVR